MLFCKASWIKDRARVFDPARPKVECKKSPLFHVHASANTAVVRDPPLVPKHAKAKNCTLCPACTPHMTANACAGDSDLRSVLVVLLFCNLFTRMSVDFTVIMTTPLPNLNTQSLPICRALFYAHYDQQLCLHLCVSQLYVSSGISAFCFNCTPTYSGRCLLDNADIRQTFCQLSFSANWWSCHTFNFFYAASSLLQTQHKRLLRIIYCIRSQRDE